MNKWTYLAAGLIGCALLIAALVPRDSTPEPTAVSTSTAVPRLPPLPTLPTTQFEASVKAQIEEAFEAALSDPTNVRHNGHLGMVLHAYERYRGAASAYQRAMLLEPSEFRWAYYLGLVLFKAGEFGEAQAALNRALRIRPNDLHARVALAELAFEREQPQTAVALLEKLDAKQVLDAHVQHLMGKAYQSLGQTNQAITHYETALTLAPEFGAVHYALTLLYRGIDADLAKTHQARYITHKDKQPLRNDPLMVAVQRLNVGARGLAARGKQLLVIGRLKEAAAAFVAATQQDPSYVAAHASLVYVYWQTSQVALAESHYEKAISLEPNSEQAHINFGLLRTGHGRYAEAADAFRKAVQANPNNAFAMTLLGYALELDGHVQDARSYYVQSLELEPHQQRANFLLGKQYLVAGDGVNAQNHFATVFQTEPSQHPWFEHQIGLAYADAGDDHQARLYLERGAAKATELNQSRLAAQISSDLTRLTNAQATN